jgi:uncharacterized protein DUF1826
MPDIHSVLRTDRKTDLAQISESYVQAVIYLPIRLPDWLLELGEAVGNRIFRVPRTTLHDVSADEIRAWLVSNLPAETVSAEARQELISDILDLVDLVGSSTGSSRFSLRILVAEPNCRCGFHVDTVPPRTSRWGLLRVYNGEGTDYVESGNVTSMSLFYKYTSKRDRLMREIAEAELNCNGERAGTLRKDLDALDRDKPFLKDPARVATAPSGSIVAFKHLDVTLHWANHDPGLAWIHCSPMAGSPRLVVNVMPQPSKGRPALPD